MNDRRYRNSARPSPPNAPMGDPRERWDGPPEYEEEYVPRPPRRSRDQGGAPDQRPPRGPAGPETPPRPPRFRDDGDPGYERRPPRVSRDPGMPPPREPRSADGERLERPSRGTRPEGREGRPDSRPGFDEMGMRPRRPRPGPDEMGMRPRRPRPPGSQPRRRKAPGRRRLHWRYRYGALIGIMVFAAAGGISLGLSDIGGHQVNIGLILVGIPALLLSMGCAALYIYF